MILKLKAKDNQIQISELIWMGASIEKITMETHRVAEKEALSALNTELIPQGNNIFYPIFPLQILSDFK